MSFAIALDSAARYERALWQIWAANSAAVQYTPHSVDYVTRFHVLVDEWRLSTAASSRLRDKVSHPAFREIVNMGEVAVPLIVRELTQRQDFLFMALNEILPMTELGLANTARTPINMISAWLAWADRNNVAAD